MLDGKDPIRYRDVSIIPYTHYRLRHRAFTLIELLVSVSIFSIVAVVLYSSLRSGVISWRRIESEHAFQQKVRYAFNRIEKDVKNIVYFSGIPFEGSGDKTAFFTLVKQSGAGETSLKRVSYDLGTGEDEMHGMTLMRIEEPLKDAMHNDSAEEIEEVADEEQQQQQNHGRPLLDGVADIKFSYLSAFQEVGGYADVEYEWLDVWETEDRLPIGIKIDLGLIKPDGEKIRISKRLWIPVSKSSKGGAPIKEE